MKHYNQESDEWYFLESDLQYLENELHNYLSFLPKRTKNVQVEKLVTNSDDKTDYVIHIRNLKELINHGLIIKNVHRVIKFH